MLGAAEARRICARALAAARRVPGAAAKVTLSSARGGHTRVAAGQVTHAADTDEVTLEIAIALGRRSASASTNQTDDRALGELVDRAVRLAKIVPESDEVLPPLGRQRYVSDGAGALDPAAAKLDAAGRARALGSALALARAAGVELAAFYQHAAISTTLADSAGLWAHDVRTRWSLSCSARLRDGAGWAGACGHRLAELAPDELAKVAIGKAQASVAPRRLPPGRYTVVLEPAATAALVRFLTDALDARAADEGRSFFARRGDAGARLGERLFPAHVTVRSDPRDFAADGRPFDLEGVPQRPAAWIDRGVLTALPCDRAWAARSRRAATGWPDGLALDGGADTVDELVRGVERGLLVTRFFYLGLVDPMTLQVTGITRDGVFLIERGAVVGAVSNFRFNHSPVELLARCDGLGPSRVVAIDGGVRFRAPALRSHEMTFSATSESV